MIDDDKLLPEIERLAREEDAEERRRFNARWQRLSEGSLSEEEDAELRAAALESDEARLDYEAFRPLSAGFRERLVEDWQGRTGGTEKIEEVKRPNVADAALPSPSPSLPSPSEPSPSEPPADIESPRAPRSSRRRNRRGRLALVGTLAAAALALIVLRVPEPVPPLPSFDAQLEGAIREQRAEPLDPAPPGTVPRFQIGRELRLLLRPTEAVDAVLTQRAYLENAEGIQYPFDGGYAVSAEGVVTLEGVLGPDLEPGLWTLIVIYGFQGHLPDLSRLPADAVEDDGWRILRLPIRLEADPATAPLEVSYKGCWLVMVTEGGAPACIEWKEIVLWARPPPGRRLQIWSAGRPLEEGGENPEGIVLQTETFGGGLRFRLSGIRVEHQAIEVRALPEGPEPWRLELAKNDVPDWLMNIAYDFHKADPADLHARLSDGLEKASLAHRGRIHSLLARLPGVEESFRVSHLDQAVTLHRESGQLLDLAEDLAMLFSLNLQARRFQDASSSLAALEEFLALEFPGSAAPAEARFNLLFNRGTLEQRRGRPRAALPALREAAELGRRMGMTRLQADAEDMLADVLRVLGRAEESLAVLRGLDPDLQISPCQRVRLLNNRAWGAILAASDAQAPELDEALELLEAGLVAAGDRGCEAHLDLLLNQALAHTIRGERAEAFRSLAGSEALAGAGNVIHHVWREDIEGRLALDAGDAAAALARYRKMAELARDSWLPEERWLAQIGQARAHVLRDDLPAALAALAAAEEVVDRHSLDVPLHEGRQLFVTRREEGTRLYLDLLLGSGQVAEAMVVARRGRARVLRSLRRGQRLADLTPEQQVVWDQEIATYQLLREEHETARAEAWSKLSGEALAQHRQMAEQRRVAALAALDRAYGIFSAEGPADGLPARRSGEAMLTYHRLPAPGEWVGFAALGEAPPTAQTFQLPDGELPAVDVLTNLLLEPFAGLLDQAERVRVLAHGRLRAVDFHALPWRGDVLLAARPVVYGLDLEQHPAEVSASPLAWRAAVIADPRGDLPAAQHEGMAVLDVLDGAGWEVSSLQGGAATLRAVREELTAGRPSLVHYAGHGFAARGASGGKATGVHSAEDALLLAGRSRLTLGDVLALPEAPAWVVLSSCESARAGGDAALAGLGTAQAFLVAGTRAVVASTRPVGDEETAELFARFYATWPQQLDLAEHLRSAQLAWRAARRGTDWAAFRVLEP